MSATSRMQWKVYWFLCCVTAVLFVSGLVVFAFSGFEVRQRAAKHACEQGKVDACVQVARYYEERSQGLVAFLLSNSDTAIRYHTRACAGLAGPSCERMVFLLKNAEQARDLSTPLTELVDAAIKACIAQVPGACDHLGELFDQGDWVAVRAARAFQRGCDEGTPEACFRLAVFHANELGGLDKTLEKILPLYEKGCAGHIEQSCKMADLWRIERDRRAAEAK